MIQCENCKKLFDLEMVEGCAGVNSSGKFIGTCPHCEFNNTSEAELPPAMFSDTEITMAVNDLKVRRDNFAQRVIDELYEKHGMFPSKLITFRL